MEERPLGKGRWAGECEREVGVKRVRVAIFGVEHGSGRTSLSTTNDGFPICSILSKLIMADVLPSGLID